MRLTSSGGVWLWSAFLLTIHKHRNFIVDAKTKKNLKAWGGTAIVVVVVLVVIGFAKKKSTKVAQVANKVGV